MQHNNIIYKMLFQYSCTVCRSFCRSFCRSLNQSKELLFLTSLPRLPSIGTKYRCSIRSFDHLTDKLRRNLFWPFAIFDYRGRLSDDQVNRVISPFFQHMSSAAWKSYRTSADFSQYHSLGCSGPGLLECRPENIALLDRFLQFDTST
jgi:hypothetical protein